MACVSDGAGAMLVGGSLIPAGRDLGAYPVGIVSSGVKPGLWEIYR